MEFTLVIRPFYSLVELEFKKTNIEVKVLKSSQMRMVALAIYMDENVEFYTRLNPISCVA